MLEEKICPYPGLRPFNEDESIFFRGREEHIEKIISQLEEKKFVMLTGASGDGKSSIVYAGVIPNARAGFFKAKFNSWQIADFRPERSPMRNMAIAIANKLGYGDIDFVEKELGFGFSSLINLYKKSPFYLDQNGVVWNSADDTEKKKLKRKAANLFVLVDQFEEFFTNAENYHNGKASDESQAVINLLLETARIALAEDLPIYIICTMRSDYIGQCAAFRGLPEYIGFSQFFVPRLKRKEIHQVIEEPATLSGNTISNRLTETLINELGEGFDQLPVLQHALNQIWKQADKGHQEMDLIHLAKLSGLPVSALPAEDKNIFSKWFTTVPEFKKGFFKNPSLESVLNAHANELYQTASEYYNSRHEEKISKEDAATIIKATFQCLTKIDDSRAVRNRMTLEEITQVINRPEITTELVGGTLEIFRLQGNTFLKPFATTDPSSLILKPDDVLDITHESLIRNWDLLTEWAKEEHENWLNFLDFNKQLERWIGSGKAAGYLLPIGPLTFFENWYVQCKPNKYWLARYDESDASFVEKLAKAETTLRQADEFIKQSSNRLFFSRFVMKHGAKKITFWLIYMIFLPIIIHYYWDYRHKQNDWIVENEITQRSLEMLASPKVTNSSKADFLIYLERLEPGYSLQALQEIDVDTMEFDIAKEMFGKIQNYESWERGEDKINPFVNDLVAFMDRRVTNLLNRDRVAFDSTKSINLSRLNAFLTICAFMKSHDDSAAVNQYISRETFVLDNVLRSVLKESPDSCKVNLGDFGNSVQLLIALAPETDFSYYLRKLSPFEMKDEASNRFNKYYKDGRGGEYLGYRLLSYLYAATKEVDTDKILSCMSMANVNKNEDPVWKYYSFNDVLMTLAAYDHLSFGRMDSLVNDQSKSSSTDVIILYDQMLDDASRKGMSYEKLTELYWYNRNYVSNFLTRKERENVAEKYLNALSELKASGNYFSYRNSIGHKENQHVERINHTFSEEDLEFKKAMHYKRQGFMYAQLYTDTLSANKCFSKAFESYRKLSGGYRSSTYIVGAANKTSWQPELVEHSSAFLYPLILNEYMEVSFQEGGGTATQWNPFIDPARQPRSTIFFEYMRKNKMQDVFESPENRWVLKKFAYLFWNADYNEDSTGYAAMNFIKTLAKLDSGHLFRSAGNYTVNKYFYSLSEINRLFCIDESEKAMELYSSINIKDVIAADFLADMKDDAIAIDNHKDLLKSLAKHLAYNDSPEAFTLVNTFKNERERIGLMTSIVYGLQEKGPVENTFLYLDSIYASTETGNNPSMNLKLITVLGMIGTEQTISMASVRIKDLPDQSKPRGMFDLVRGIAYSGYYYNAKTTIPEYISSDLEIILYNEILRTEVVKRKKSSETTQGNQLKVRDGWKQYDHKASLFYEGGFSHNN